MTRFCLLKKFNLEYKSKLYLPPSSIAPVPQTRTSTPNRLPNPPFYCISSLHQIVAFCPIKALPLPATVLSLTNAEAVQRMGNSSELFLLKRRHHKRPDPQVLSP